MGSLFVMPATRAHAAALAGDVDAEHLCLPAGETLERGLEMSTQAWVAMADGKPVAMWGVVEFAPPSKRRRNVWVVASRAARAMPRAVVRTMRAALVLLLERWPLLYLALREGHPTRLVRALGFVEVGQLESNGQAVTVWELEAP